LRDELSFNSFQATIHDTDEPSYEDFILPNQAELMCDEEPEAQLYHSDEVPGECLYQVDTTTFPLTTETLEYRDRLLAVEEFQGGSIEAWEDPNTSVAESEVEEGGSEHQSPINMAPSIEPPRKLRFYGIYVKFGKVIYTLSPCLIRRLYIYHSLCPLLYVALWTT
jgi:hypothetical protein